MINNNNDSNDEFLIDFEDDSIDMTNPDSIKNNADSVYRSRVVPRNTPQKKVKSSIVQKITGFLVFLGMLIALGFLGYLLTLHSFDVDKYLPLIKSVGALVYGLFIIDGIVMWGAYKQISILLFAILLPVFYPLKRSGVTSSRKNLQALWLVGIIVLFGFVLTNVYTQVEHKILLVKTSSDSYSEKYDDAVRFLKGSKIDDKKILVEIIRNNIEDYKWTAQDSSDNSYIIMVTGNSEITTPDGVSADVIYNNNTCFKFLVNSELTQYKVIGMTLNGEDESKNAEKIWNDLCTK